MFNFIGCSRGIRCDGFFQAEDIHIRYEEIGAMIYERNGEGPKMILPHGQILQ